MEDARNETIAIIIPQYIDASFKGTLRFLTIISKKIVFIGTDELIQRVESNKIIDLKE